MRTYRITHKHGHTCKYGKVKPTTYRRANTETLTLRVHAGVHTHTHTQKNAHTSCSQAGDALLKHTDTYKHGHVSLLHTQTRYLDPDTCLDLEASVLERGLCVAALTS